MIAQESHNRFATSTEFVRRWDFVGHVGSVCAAAHRNTRALHSAVIAPPSNAFAELGHVMILSLRLGCDLGIAPKGHRESA